MTTEIGLLFKFKWNYLCQFWSLIEMGIIICSWTAGAIYLWQYEELKRIENLFKQTNGYVFINLQLSSYVNNLLNFLFGFCCFFGTMKFLHICRFSARLSLFNQTLRSAANELISFSMMFSIVFISFLCLFYLLFNSNISTCSSVLETSQMLFELMLLKFDTSEINDGGTFLGPFCFSLFIFLVVFICLSMFISIINGNFRYVKRNVDDNQEMTLFMLRKFQRWIGMKVESV
jgi:hypothetical protein